MLSDGNTGGLMIYLKKNDKIIIVVAVVVIIIAAIGIATYVPSEDGNGDTQLTPTGNECCDFLAGTAEDLVLTANPKSGKINPGRFFYYTMFEATGDTNIEVITYSDPDPAPDPTAEGVKVFIVQNGGCKHVSRHATITKTDNVVNIFVPAEIVAQSEDGTLIFRVEYKPPKYYGVETTFHFETYLLNGSPQMVASESITTVEK